MDSAAVGTTLAIIGAIGFVLQLSLYPSVNRRLGTVQCYRLFGILFPIAYFCVPYISLIPVAAWFSFWTCISIVLFLQVLARTFTLPATIILINNCSPHPSVLGTVHGIGQAVSAAFRALGPIVSGYWNNLGLQSNMTGLAWWSVSLIALLGWAASLWGRDGSEDSIQKREDE